MLKDFSLVKISLNIFYLTKNSAARFSLKIVYLGVGGGGERKKKCVDILNKITFGEKDFFFLFNKLLKKN